MIFSERSSCTGFQLIHSSKIFSFKIYIALSSLSTLISCDLIAFESADSIDFSSILMGNESKITSGPESMYIDKPFIDSSLWIGFP